MTNSNGVARVDEYVSLQMLQPQHLYKQQSCTPNDLPLFIGAGAGACS